ncbi:MAG: hypothetical protein K6G11_04695 [Lachnospiraceae bacterium]|nr:hypothetical protein [Lachnospiraceae bacterium]
MSKNNGANAKQIASMYNEYLQRKRATENSTNIKEVDKVDATKTSKNIYSNNAINQNQRAHDIENDSSSKRIYKREPTNTYKSPSKTRFRYSKYYINNDSIDSPGYDYNEPKASRSSIKKRSFSQDFNKNSPGIAIQRLTNDTYKSREKYFEDVAYAAAGKIYEEQMKNEGRTTDILSNKDINKDFSIESIAQDLLKSPAFKNSLKSKTKENAYIDPKNVAKGLEDKAKIIAISTYLEDSPTREEVAEKERTRSQKDIATQKSIASSKKLNTKKAIKPMAQNEKELAKEHKPKPKKLAPRPKHTTPKPRSRAL